MIKKIIKKKFKNINKKNMNDIYDILQKKLDEENFEYYETLHSIILNESFYLYTYNGFYEFKHRDNIRENIARICIKKFIESNFSSIYKYVTIYNICNNYNYNYYNNRKITNSDCYSMFSTYSKIKELNKDAFIPSFFKYNKFTLNESNILAHCIDYNNDEYVYYNDTYYNNYNISNDIIKKIFNNRNKNKNINDLFIEFRYYTNEKRWYKLFSMDMENGSYD